MSIQGRITELSNYLGGAYAEAEAKGATMPAVQGYDALAATIESIATYSEPWDIQNGTVKMMTSASNIPAQTFCKLVTGEPPELEIADSYFIFPMPDYTSGGCTGNCSQQFFPLPNGDYVVLDNAYIKADSNWGQRLHYATIENGVLVSKCSLPLYETYHDTDGTWTGKLQDIYQIQNSPQYILYNVGKDRYGYVYKGIIYADMASKTLAKVRTLDGSMAIPNREAWYDVDTYINHSSSVFTIYKWNGTEYAADITMTGVPHYSCKVVVAGDKVSDTEYTFFTVLLSTTGVVYLHNSTTPTTDVQVRKTTGGPSGAADFKCYRNGNDVDIISTGIYSAGNNYYGYRIGVSLAGTTVFTIAGLPTNYYKYMGSSTYMWYLARYFNIDKTNIGYIFSGLICTEPDVLKAGGVSALLEVYNLSTNAPIIDAKDLGIKKAWDTVSTQLYTPFLTHGQCYNYGSKVVLSFPWSGISGRGQARYTFSDLAAAGQPTESLEIAMSADEWNCVAETACSPTVAGKVWFPPEPPTPANWQPILIGETADGQYSTPAEFFNAIKTCAAVYSDNNDKLWFAKDTYNEIFSIDIEEFDPDEKPDRQAYTADIGKVYWDEDTGYYCVATTQEIIEASDIDSSFVPPTTTEFTEGDCIEDSDIYGKYNVSIEGAGSAVLLAIPEYTPGHGDPAEVGDYEIDYNSYMDTISGGSCIIKVNAAPYHWQPIYFKINRLVEHAEAIFTQCKNNCILIYDSTNGINSIANDTYENVIHEFETLDYPDDRPLPTADDLGKLFVDGDGIYYIATSVPIVHHDSITYSNIGESGRTYFTTNDLPVAEELSIGYKFAFENGGYYEYEVYGYCDEAPQEEGVTPIAVYNDAWQYVGAVNITIGQPLVVTFQPKTQSDLAPAFVLNIGKTSATDSMSFKDATYEKIDVASFEPETSTIQSVTFRNSTPCALVITFAGGSSKIYSCYKDSSCSALKTYSYTAQMPTTTPVYYK